MKPNNSKVTTAIIVIVLLALSLVIRFINN